MKNELIGLLERIGFPAFLQGTVGETYPQSFFTIWNTAVDDGNHYDNKTAYFVWDFTVNFYSQDPLLVNTVLLQTKLLLQQNGWIVAGKGSDAPSDDPDYTGRSISVQKIEKNIGGLYA